MGEEIEFKTTKFEFEVNFKGTHYAITIFRDSKGEFRSMTMGPILKIDADELAVLKLLQERRLLPFLSNP